MTTKAKDSGPSSVEVLLPAETQVYPEKTSEYALLDRVASYRGNPQRFLLRFLEDPDAHITSILRSS